MGDVVDYFRKKFDCNCVCEDRALCSIYTDDHLNQIGLEEFDKFVDEIIAMQPASALSAFREAEIRTFGRIIT